MLPATLQSLTVMIASAINDRLRRKLDYVEEERRVLREQLDAAAAWLEVECTEARHPEVREVLSTAILRSRANKAHGQSPAVTARLRAALEGSAKPPRDPTRKRPGTDRGKASRRVK